MQNSFKPSHDKTNKMACVPSEASDQPGHPPSLISVFAVCMMKAWSLSYPLSAQPRLWSDWADAQADLSLRWAHWSVCWFCHVVAHIWYSQKYPNYQKNFDIQKFAVSILEFEQSGFTIVKYRPLPLCRLRVSRYYHLCRSDFSFPTFFLYISLHFNSVYIENG